MSKNSIYNSQKKACVYLFVISLIFVISSCSNDDDNQTPPENQIDLLEVSGRYTGGFNNITFGTSGSLSMVVSPSDNDSYSVVIFETSAFRPAFNSDGTTPELTGSIDFTNAEAIINLNLNTDNPVCNGNYTGDGTRNMEGRFSLNITQEETCAGEDFESMGEWFFQKISDETTVP